MDIIKNKLFQAYERNLQCKECRRHKIYIIEVGLGGLGVTCSPRNPRFAGLNPAEDDGFFQDVKILSTSPPGGTLTWGS